MGIDEAELLHVTRRGRVAEERRSRRRVQIWVDVDGDACDSEDDVEVAARSAAVRRPRLERDVNVDEEAEIESLVR